jgi:hypothetical protein
MATLVLQAAGSAIGGFIGGPMGAMLGRALGGLAGNMVDRSMLAGERTREGPRLTEMSGLTSTEGASIPRVYGRVRLGGEIIWATRFQETVITKEDGGGKGGFGGSGVTTRTYEYNANFAVAIAEGPISYVRRIWADGALLDLTAFAIRIYRGDETQQADPLIVAKEGAEVAPAYRGVAYVVFEGFPLKAYGNRIPQLSFEVVRAVDGVRQAVRAINMIPGAGEFVYETNGVTRSDGAGATVSENRHQLVAASDWEASIAQLTALCPSLESVSLVVSWFGDDLRAGICRIEPRVETAVKMTNGATWRAGGIERGAAKVVSLSDGKPAYGGTPSDASVLKAIADLKARGLKVTLYPFAMMDIAAGNTLPDPWTGLNGQKAYPWRGRITCHPAPGQAGSPDGTAAAATQISAFFGTAQPSHFQVGQDTVIYTGPAEWSWRRMILHYAKLAAMAGGVDAFIIGSELIGITRVRSGAGTYPAATALASLASDVKAVLGAGTKLTYAADWTEYGAHSPSTGEVRFPLDPLWASPAIDAVGIDAYWPISDWRDGPLHLDAGSAGSIYDRAYLKARFGAGEAYEWYYASAAARNSQTRTPITDGAVNKPWVWRAKDLVGWWSNAHRERVGGVELATATAWVAQGKPIWLTEFGCPAVDRGTNGPNVFPDAKSSENALPHFSRGNRDDLIQTRLIEAMAERFDPAQAGFDAAHNPVSSVYSGRMVDPARTAIWAWDARPFPAFPSLVDVWSDAGNWQTGHWVNGRLEGMALDRLIAAILKDFDVPAASEIRVDGYLDGYLVDAPMSARAALEPLADLFGFDCSASGGRLRFIGQGPSGVTSLGEDDLVRGKNDTLFSITRTQESELPQEVQLSFSDGDTDYRRASVFSRRLAGGAKRSQASEVAGVMTRSEAQRLADVALHDLWAGRETVTFSTRPGLIGVEPGDLVSLMPLDASRLFRITRVTDKGARTMEARSVEVSVYDGAAPKLALPKQAAPAIAGKPLAVIIDLPVAQETEPALQVMAVTATPWPGQMAVWRSGDGSNYSFFGTVDAPSIIGTTLNSVGPGVVGRWDLGTTIDVTVSGGSLASPGDFAALAGQKILALQGSDGSWELLAFAIGTLIGENSWRLSRLIRGLGGSEALAGRTVPAGARIVLLDAGVLTLARGSKAVGEAWNWRVVPASLDAQNPAAADLFATAGKAALMPMSPVRASGKRTADGVTLQWVRRARVNADSWGVAEIPLDESEESYEIEILSGVTVKRVLTATGPTVLYPAALEFADFGGQQTSLSVRIFQMSVSVGRGYPLQTSISL